MSLLKHWPALIALVLMVVASSLGVMHVFAQVSHAASEGTVITAALQPQRQIAKPIPSIFHLHALTVHGAALQDSTGQTVTLIGATRSSLEYLCQGDGHFTTQDFQAMRAWGMNVVRITLSSEFWMNPGGSCPTYRQTVAAAVAHAEATGLYVILVLHWSAPFDTALDRQHGGAQCPMPDTDKDVTFWSDLATNYRTDTNVLFDLYGEPQGVSWQTWYAGGPITTPCYAIYANHGAIEEKGSYTAIGMQALSAQVRAIAPQNVIIISGTDWGYNLAEVRQGYHITTTNVLYATHPFDYSTKGPVNWEHDFGQLATQTAVIATEFGAYDCGTAYISAAIHFFSAHHMSWLAWSWNTAACSGPGLIADWQGTPTPTYGVLIRQAMQATTATHAS